MITFDFTDWAVLVTGGSTGIGRATALLFARAGSNVGIISRTATNVELACSQISAESGRTCLPLAGDVTNYSQMESRFAEFVARFGRLDVLVNCAGAHNPKSVLETSLEGWNEVIGTNLTGVFICCKLAAEIMAGQRSGHIINISSVQAARGGRSLEYSASKAGVEGLTRALARQLGSYGVRVNSVAPGGIDTAFAARHWSPTTRQSVERDSIMGRVGEADEIAKAIGFLASDGASYITGTTMHVNGGLYVT